jgi:uncharacterized protein YxjI
MPSNRLCSIIMEVKIQCGCGTRYKFDWEPATGLLPGTVQCPQCGGDGTTVANDIIRQRLSAALTTLAPENLAPPASTRVRLAAPSGDTALVGPASPEASAAQLAGSGDRSLLERTSFFVKERAGLLKLTDTYDILDPATGRNIGIAREEPPIWAKWLRLVIAKQTMPTTVNIYEQEGRPPVLSIHRGFTFIRSKVRVVAGGKPLGYFKSKLISIGGGFNVFDNQDQQVAEVKGNWKGWDFKFVSKQGREIGSVTKKWAGLGKELFTSADNYIISLKDLSGASPVASALLLAAGLAIDVVYKEGE